MLIEPWASTNPAYWLSVALQWHIDESLPAADKREFPTTGGNVVQRPLQFRAFVAGLGNVGKACGSAGRVWCAWLGGGAIAGLSGKEAVPSGATGMASGVPAGSGPASAPDQTSSAGPERAAKAYSPVAWFNCKGIASSSEDAPSNPANFIKKTDGGDTPGSNPEEKAILLALPAPCDGKPPRMAVLEATLFSAEDILNDQQGINLLDGLHAFVGANFVSSTVTGSNPSVTRTLTTAFGLGSGAAGADGMLQYTLNAHRPAHRTPVSKHWAVRQPVNAARNHFFPNRKPLPC